MLGASRRSMPLSICHFAHNREWSKPGSLLSGVWIQAKAKLVGVSTTNYVGIPYDSLPEWKCEPLPCAELPNMSLPPLPIDLLSWSYGVSSFSKTRCSFPFRFLLPLVFCHSVGQYYKKQERTTANKNNCKHNYYITSTLSYHIVSSQSIAQPF